MTKKQTELIKFMNARFKEIFHKDKREKPQQESIITAEEYFLDHRKMEKVSNDNVLIGKKIGYLKLIKGLKKLSVKEIPIEDQWEKFGSRKTATIKAEEREFKMPEEEHKCVCGKEELVDLRYIKNRITDKIVEVGSCCIQKFEDEGGNLAQKCVNCLQTLQKIRPKSDLCAQCEGQMRGIIHTLKKDSIGKHIKSKDIETKNVHTFQWYKSAMSEIKKRRLQMVKQYNVCSYCRKNFSQPGKTTAQICKKCAQKYEGFASGNGDIYTADQLALQQRFEFVKLSELARLLNNFKNVKFIHIHGGGQLLDYKVLSLDWIHSLNTKFICNKTMILIAYSMQDLGHLGLKNITFQNPGKIYVTTYQTMKKFCKNEQQEKLA